MDELLQQAAEKRGLPASLVERSAKARAEETGQSVEEVLAEWAGVEADGSGAAATNDEGPTANHAAGQEPAASSQEQDAEGVPAEITDDYLVSLAAKAKRMPESLVRTSAEARAKHAGVELAVVLADWAGVDLAELHDQAGKAPQSPAASPSSPEPRPEPETPAETRDESTEETPTPASAPAAAAAVALSADELLEKAAEARGVPASLTKRSAQARADEEGKTLEEVLAEWAGVEATAAPSAAASGAPAETSQEPAASSQEPAAPAAAAGATFTVDELLDKAAEARGVPAVLTKRSAEARAKEEGTTLEAVLAEWAGIDPSQVATAGQEPAASSQQPTAPAVPDEVIEAEPEKPVEEVEVIEASAGSPDEDLHEVETPSKVGRYPAWLAAAFLIIPLLAVTYILVAPNGPDCGVGGQLLVDEVTGEAVNCDGSEYGVVEIDHFANGGAIYNVQCATCHNADGSGGAGPAFIGGALLTTFPEGACVDHQAWVGLGTAGWPDPTYGANGTPVGSVGVMPGFGSGPNPLTPEQIAEVALYERVQFGGEDLEDALADCGFDEEGLFTPPAGEPTENAEG